MNHADKKPGFWDREFNLTIDENLNKLKGKILAPKKLEEANKHLKRMKTLPKIK